MPMNSSKMIQFAAGVILAYLMAGCASTMYVPPRAAATAPANANEHLVRDVVPNWRHIAALSSYSPAMGGWYSCARLRTQPGSKWVVTEKEPLLSGATLVTMKLGVGADCTSAQWLLEAKDPPLGMNTKLEFTAGGGSYLILLKQYAGARSQFEFEVTEADPSAQFAAIAPGVRDYVVPSGTASTVASTSGPNYAVGETFRDCPMCPLMVALPADTFMMGSDSLEDGRDASEGPRHSVTLKRSFAIGATEVTFEQYDACVRAGACAAANDQGWGRGNRPVINVTLDDALKYVAWLSGTTGHSYFIPSEAEWEYAARAGTTSPWNTGSAIITADANFLNHFKKTVPVGSYPPNAFGLHDMHGNVAEWVQDCLDTGYLGVPTDGSAVLRNPCSVRIIRGGHFANEPRHIRSAARLQTADKSWDVGIGFRVTRALSN